MAMDLETVSVTVKERTHRVEIITKLGEDPLVVGYREKVWLMPDGTVVKREDVAQVQRKLSVVAAQKIGSLTGAQFAGAISLAIDQFRAEDIALETANANA